MIEQVFDDRPDWPPPRRRPRPRADDLGVTTDDATTFADLGLRPELLAALATLGYEEPTPIQREAIPQLVAGRDLLGQAATGTGKTAAFALPVLQALPAGDRGVAPTAMVLVPTRELAVQVSEALHRYGRELGARVLPIYGGQPIGRQLAALKRGVDVIVATPGRAVDHLNRGTLALDTLETVVLDEADEMLDMGFADELEAILAATPPTRQTVLFSATLPRRIDGIARRHLRDPVRIEIERETRGEGAGAAGPAERVRRRARPQGGGARTHPRHRVAHRRDRVLPHPRRGRPAHRDPQRPRLPGRGAARRHEPGAARPGDGPAARGNGRPARRHRRRRPRPGHRPADPRRELRGPVGTGRLRPPDRPGRSRRARRRRHHPRRTARAPDAQDHRAGDRAAHPGREGADDGRPARRTARAHPGRPARDPARGPPRAVPRHRRHPHRRLRRDAGGDGRGEARPRVQRHRPRPGGDPRGGAAPGPRRGRSRAPTGGPRRTPGADRKSRTLGTTRIFVAAGRAAGIRPQDLVGAIAGESRLSGRDIGAIEITDRFSLVEVPDDAVSEVVEALRNTRIKGRKVQVRRDRG